MNTSDIQTTNLNLPTFLDSTMISTFRSCPKKFYWQYMLNLKSLGSNIHLTAGAALASALDAIRQEQAKHSTALPVDHLYEVGFKAFLNDWDGPLDEEEIPPAYQAKNIHNMLAVLEAYINEHHPFYDDVQPYRLPDGSVSSEFSFAIPLPTKHPTTNDPFIYVGRFDMLGVYTPSGAACVFDDKTTGSLSTHWTQQWDLRGQFLGYVWACQQLGYPVSHAVVRGTGIMKTDTRFLTIPLSYDNHMIERWYLELLDTLELMKMMNERNHWPYNFADACTSYGGCPMKDLCLAREPAQWFSNYEVRVWNPVTGEDE